jgi:hypothetical protein
MQKDYNKVDELDRVIKELKMYLLNMSYGY